MEGMTAESKVRKLEKLLFACKEAMLADGNIKYINTYNTTDWSHLIDAIDAEIGIGTVEAEP